MNVRISFVSQSDTEDHTYYQNFINSVKSFFAKPPQIQILKTGWSQLNHPYPGSIEDKLSATEYEHYLILSIVGQSKSQTFLLTNLFRELCTVLGDDFELFYEDIS